ncbi:MAG: saccharopine dehydrogenase NADP-binding domain-containing protein [Deltaproteobacteria bacterium]|nr:saccharopine dehydrogenase NADP-binding domain-containing protein [Deltaproteobacteria bacterium]
MIQSSRKFDLIVFGSAGFAGKVAAQYFARNVSGKVRWAVAGRSRDKMDRLKEVLRPFQSQPAEYVIVDHADGEGVHNLISQTRVAINYAGPFGRSGENIVAACAKLGTHYLDITGEPLWVERMIEKYAPQASASGAILIPFSGFDSVPSDLGAWWVVELAREKDALRPVTKVVSLFSVRGGINGGTYETMLDMLALSNDDQQRLRNLSLLVPKDARVKFNYPEVKKPVWVPAAGVTAPPFFMEPINSKVVYRSQALRLGKTAGDQGSFQYVELMRLSKGASAAKAWAYVAGAAAFYRVGRNPWVLKLLKKFGVKSGQGPSPDVQENGFFRAQFYAYSGKELVSQFEMSYPGDPGNKATAVLSCESALCLVENADAFSSLKGGFWTPSTALGLILYARLAKAGVQFSV